MAGNHLRRCALMCWSFSILNDDTKCRVWWVKSRNTETKKQDRKSCAFLKNGWKPSQKTRLDALIIFHIEWRHQVSSLVGKQSKYRSKKCKTENHVVFKDGWKPHFAACKLSIGVLINAFLVAFDFCIFLQISECSWCFSVNSSRVRRHP